MASQARGLQNFISDLRNAKSKVRETTTSSNTPTVPTAVVERFGVCCLALRHHDPIKQRNFLLWINVFEFA